MKVASNNHGQPIGEVVENWSTPDTPRRETFPGHYCMLVPLDTASHAANLFQAYASDPSGQDWTYLAYGPFLEFEQFHAWLSEQSKSLDPLFFAVVEAKSGLAVGIASFMRMAPSTGVIEIGHIHFSRLLQGKIAATEALLTSRQ